MCIRFDPVTGERAPLYSRDMRAWDPLLPGRKRSIFPYDRGQVLTWDADGDFTTIDVQWGLLPFWAKKGPKGSEVPDPLYGKKNAYNARAETVSEKPTFRGAFKKRRCLVPAYSFYERGDKRWLRVRQPDDAIMCFAGLWEPRYEALSEVPTFTFVTTEPNAAMGKVHDRMPVILGPDQYDFWLNPASDLDEIKRLLVPCPDEWLIIEDAGEIVVSNKKDGSPASETRLPME